MLGKIFGWLIAIAVIGGLIAWVATDPAGAGQSGANVVGTIVGVGQAFWTALETFFTSLPF